MFLILGFHNIYIYGYQLLSRNSFINTTDDNVPLFLLEMTFLSSLNPVAIFELVVFKKVQVTLGKFTNWPWKIPKFNTYIYIFYTYLQNCQCLIAMFAYLRVNVANAGDVS